MVNLYLFGYQRSQLSERILDSEQKVLETVTGILNEVAKDEMKMHFYL
jgi:hypothetical protein